jgi:hypothetical protein
MRPPSPVANRREDLGIIFSDATYPLQEFQRVSGLGDAAVRKAKRQGLVVHQVGSRKFIRGQDWNDFLDQRSKPHNPRA